MHCNKQPARGAHHRSWQDTDDDCYGVQVSSWFGGSWHLPLNKIFVEIASNATVVDSLTQKSGQPIADMVSNKEVIDVVSDKEVLLRSRIFVGSKVRAANQWRGLQQQHAFVNSLEGGLISYTCESLARGCFLDRQARPLELRAAPTLLFVHPWSFFLLKFVLFLPRSTKQTRAVCCIICVLFWGFWAPDSPGSLFRDESKHKPRTQFCSTALRSCFGDVCVNLLSGSYPFVALNGTMPSFYCLVLVILVRSLLPSLTLAFISVLFWNCIQTCVSPKLYPEIRF